MCSFCQTHLHSQGSWSTQYSLPGLPVQDAPFFTVKLQVKMLPCLIFFQNGVACDRAVGFDDYGASDDFTTTSVERRLLKSGKGLLLALQLLCAGCPQCVFHIELISSCSKRLVLALLYVCEEGCFSY